MSRLVQYINEKVSKKEQEEALNNKNIWIGMEFEFKLNDVEGGIDPDLESDHQNAMYDWRQVKKAQEEYEDEIRELERKISERELEIDRENDEEEPDEDYIERLEKDKDDFESELQDLRDSFYWDHIDMSDYLPWMEHHQSMDFENLLDNDWPEPLSPEELELGSNLDDFYQWRDAVEDIVYKMHLTSGFIDDYELNDYGGTKQKKGSNVWGFEYDPTVSPDGGIELVSPPMKLPEMIDILPDVFALIKEYGYTDGDCGLHAHMSVEDGELDLTKLIFFTEEENIYKYFPERVGSHYAQSLKNKIRKSDAKNISVELKKGLRKIPKKSDLVKTLAKYDAIHHIEGSRIEFRHMGARGYEKKYNDIKNILARHSFALSVGVDPEWRKQEYIKRIVRVLNKIERGMLEYKKTMLNWFIISMEKDYMGDYFDRLSFPWSLSKNWNGFTPEIKAKIKRVFEREMKRVEREIKQTGVKFDNTFYGAPTDDITEVWKNVYKDINTLYYKDKEFNKLASR